MRTRGLACLLTGLIVTGCFGSFNMTRKVYHFNRGASSDRWVREIVFLALVVVPVYEIASVLDALVLNSLEFWTGRNPVLAHDGDSQTIETAQGRATLTRLSASALEVELVGSGGPERRFVLTREADGFSARERGGALIARVGDREALPAPWSAQGVESALRTSSAVVR